MHNKLNFPSRIWVTVIHHYCSLGSIQIHVSLWSSVSYTRLLKESLIVQSAGGVKGVGVTEHENLSLEARFYRTSIGIFYAE